MDIDKLELFIKQLIGFDADEADKAFAYFKEEWPQFTKDERNILSRVVVGITLNIMEKDVSIKTQLHWLAIANYSEKPVIDGKVVDEDNDDIFPRLKLGEGIKGNQITKLFHDLKINGVIIGSNEQIAEAINIIFPIEYSTAYKDLTEEKRLQKVISLFTVSSKSSL